MLKHRVNGYDMPYVEIGAGTPLVAIHGSLGDFRSWVPVMGPLSQSHRLIVPSLRHFFPDKWSGSGGTYTIAQHIRDTIAFLEALGTGPVHLMGHSRGGHIAFRVAQQRPDLVIRLVLAEPGGELDASLMPTGVTPTAERTESIVEAARLIARGDVDQGLAHFIDRIYGPGAWARQPAAGMQRRRDNASTIVAQLEEQRQAFSRADALAIRAPTLLIGGELTKGMLPVVLGALAEAIPGARKAMIPMAAHSMFEQAPVAFSQLVLAFLGSNDA